MDLILLLIKIGFLIGLSVYTIFAIVVVRQTHHMTKTLEVGFETPIKIASWIHLFFAICTLVLAFVIL
jgi:hypothetical protein